jgi:hypothetical protein
MTTIKQCPKCRREYTDGTLRFCLDDGTALVGQTSEATTMLYSGATTPSQGVVATSRPSNAGRVLSIIAILLALGSFLLVIIGLIASAMNVREDAVGGLVVFSVPGACLGVLLGLVGLYRAYRAKDGMGARKTAIVSVALNLLFLLVLAGLLILGLAGTMMSE